MVWYVPRAERSMRSSFSATVALVALINVQCMSTRPSEEPLGWGPLPPGALSASHRPRSRTPPVAEEHEEPRDEPAASTDAGHEPEKVAAAAAPSSSAPKPPESKLGAVQASSASLAEFVGEYLGEAVATYRITGLPERTERDPKARVTVKASTSPELLFVLVDSSNGKDICTLSGTMKDSKVSIGSGQKCFEQNEGEASAGATVTKGSATLE